MISLTTGENDHNAYPFHSILPFFFGWHWHWDVANWMILQESGEVFVAFLSSPSKDALQGDKERGGERDVIY